jgi:hypothetical protein
MRAVGHRRSQLGKLALERCMEQHGLWYGGGDVLKSGSK